MRPYRYVLTALVIAGFAAANDASLAQHRTSGKGQSYLKQFGSIKVVRQRVPSRRVLGSHVARLGCSSLLPVTHPYELRWALHAAESTSMSLLLNIGDAPATLIAKPVGGLAPAEGRKLGNLFSPFALDEFVGPATIEPGPGAICEVPHQPEAQANCQWRMVDVD